MYNATTVSVLTISILIVRMVVVNTNVREKKENE